MHILCDTSSILMLIRIAPEMFIEKEYECCTIGLVRKEIFGTQRFKTKYPWRIQFKNKVKSLPHDISDNNEVQRYFDAISSLIEHGRVNERTGVEFDLSYIDKRLLACALCNGYKISSGDADMKQFAKQEFAGDFRGWISALGIVNRWLDKGLIKWDRSLHVHLAEWEAYNEHPQPQRQKNRFKKLTKRNYPGS